MPVSLEHRQRVLAYLEAQERGLNSVGVPVLHVPRQTENELEQYEMRFREHTAVQSRVDFFFVDPRKLKVDAEYNVRSMDSKETREHIAGLKASIIANGVKVPLEVRLDDDEKIYIVAGHCRHVAVMEAIKEGHEIKAVPCIPEAARTSAEDRAVNLIISNSGKPLAPLEVAAVVKRLVNFGWLEKQIAERLGWKSTNTVKQHLELLTLPESVKKHGRDRRRIVNAMSRLLLINPVNSMECSVMSRRVSSRFFSSAVVSTAPAPWEKYLPVKSEPALEPRRVADLAKEMADKLKTAPAQKRPNRYRRGTSRLYGMSDSGNA